MEHRSPRRGPIARAGAARAGRPAPPRRRIGTRAGDRVCSAPPARCAAHGRMRWRSDRKNPSDARSSVARSLRLLIVRSRGMPLATAPPRRLAFALIRGENWRMRDVPLLRRNCGFDSPVARLAALGATLVALAPAATFAQTNAPSPVGLKQLEYLAEGNRHLALTMFYPAAVRDRSAARFVMPFFTNLELSKDAAATASITPGSPSFWRRAAMSWLPSTIIAPIRTTRRLPISRTSCGNG